MEDYTAYAMWACRDLYAIQRYFGASVVELSQLTQVDRAELYHVISGEEK